MYTQKPYEPKPAQTLGNMQATFTYRLSNFISNDQITIVEDLPKNRPVRQLHKTSQKGVQYDVYLIKISSNGFEADLEMFAMELNTLAIACPKGTDNFKGITLVHNGRSFVFLSKDLPLDASVPQRDVRQPDLSAPVQAPQQDQKDVHVKTLIDGIKAVNMIGTDVFASDVLKMASKISPGHEVELVGYAKSKGLVHEEQGGVYKVS